MKRPEAFLPILILLLVLRPYLGKWFVVPTKKFLWIQVATMALVFPALATCAWMGFPGEDYFGERAFLSGFIAVMGAMATALLLLRAKEPQ